VQISDPWLTAAVLELGTRRPDLVDKPRGFPLPIYDCFDRARPSGAACFAFLPSCLRCNLGARPARCSGERRRSTAVSVVRQLQSGACCGHPAASPAALCGLKTKGACGKRRARACMQGTSVPAVSTARARAGHQRPAAAQHDLGQRQRPAVARHPPRRRARLQHGQHQAPPRTRRGSAWAGVPERLLSLTGWRLQ